MAERYQTRDHKLVIHLYRNYRLHITFAAEATALSNAQQRELLAIIQEHQADFLAKIAQLRHNCTNFLKLIADSEDRTNHRGVFANSLGWYQAHRPEFYERFKQLLLDIRNLLPSLPASELDLEDDEIIEQIRRFEEEANAVIVNPVRDMAFKVLTQTLIAEGLLTEQAMNVHFNLKDWDFTRQQFARVIARVISSRGRLYFRKNVSATLLAANINVLQGQLDGHCSHLMSLLTNRDMSSFVQSTLRGIRYRFLPVIMRQAVKEITDLDQYRSAIFAHTMFRENISFKDVVLHNTTITPGYLAECADAIEPLTHPRDPEGAPGEDEELVTLRVVQQVTRGLDRLDQFGMGISRLPEQELDLKIKFIRSQFIAGIDACLSLLGNYHRIFDKVEEAVRPLMGMISFDTGGQSDFYARWFPGLNVMLQRDNLIEPYITVLEQLKENMADQEDEVVVLREIIDTWLTPEVLERVSFESPHIGNFLTDSLVDVLSNSYLFLRTLAEFPEWFYELETNLLNGIDAKKAQAQRVIAAGKG